MTISTTQLDRLSDLTPTSRRALSPAPVQEEFALPDSPSAPRAASAGYFAVRPVPFSHESTRWLVAPPEPLIDSSVPVRSIRESYGRFVAPTKRQFHAHA